MSIDEKLDLEQPLESSDRTVRVDGHQERRAQWAYPAPQPQPQQHGILRFFVLALVLGALVVGAYWYKQNGGELP